LRKDRNLAKAFIGFENVYDSINRQEICKVLHKANVSKDRIKNIYEICENNVVIYQCHVNFYEDSTPPKKKIKGFLHICRRDDNITPHHISLAQLKWFISYNNHFENILNGC
jgi:hypothetical protein